jgi:hypothetical protein
MPVFSRRCLLVHKDQFSMATCGRWAAVCSSGSPPRRELTSAAVTAVQERDRGPAAVPHRRGCRHVPMRGTSQERHVPSCRTSSCGHVPSAARSRVRERTDKSSIPQRTSTTHTLSLVRAQSLRHKHKHSHTHKRKRKRKHKHKHKHARAHRHTDTRTHARAQCFESDAPPAPPPRHPPPLTHVHPR